MATENNVDPAGTGQQGAGMPAGTQADIPVHIEGEPEHKLEHSADHAARRGLERQHREDPTEFTK
ncbi:hypothetical protein ACPOL_5759 [Acidisarcina polymorpha]|uniref:Uncharacterized protein n=1 Tax=Acidisarcina polymorpha TaxID=2211140 RepID=A0A2Z5G8L9_9BACT|nr:hypothetical protein [Acidisarcina polymorpha]AXC15005.1 hypothetical protein ACPOL_5759 [Acidisarcina polymorpha]